MAAKQPPGRSKKYYTAAEANAALPLVRSIVSDIAKLAANLSERHERLTRIRPPKKGGIDEAHAEELRQVQEDFERDQERMREFEVELDKLGVELKDYHTGLIDFRCWMDDREVYLCWRLGEPAVGHWHELDAGFSGRKKLREDALVNR